MIKVNELRVGNIVLYKQDNDELPVLKIDGDKKTVCLDLLLGLNMELNEQDIDPIPLTPEWLERCGFKKEPDGIDQRTGKIIEGKWIHDDYLEWPGLLYLPNYEIKYLHQLQNIYFALTGEELQIKPA